MKKVLPKSCPRFKESLIPVTACSGQAPPVAPSRPVHRVQAPSTSSRSPPPSPHAAAHGRPGTAPAACPQALGGRCRNCIRAVSGLLWAGSTAFPAPRTAGPTQTGEERLNPEHRGTRGAQDSKAVPPCAWRLPGDPGSSHSPDGTERPGRLARAATSACRPTHADRCRHLLEHCRTCSSKAWKWASN